MTRPGNTTYGAPFRVNWWARFGWLIAILYSLYAANYLDVSWSRFVAGLGNGAAFIGEMFPVDFSRWKLLVSNLLETVEIAVIASAFGVLLSLPIGLLAARNLMPTWVTWPFRIIIALCRSFHPVIFAILFVKAVGFGPLAGILTLIFASIGFIGKLFAEAIEEISLKPLEATFHILGFSDSMPIAIFIKPQDTRYGRCETIVTNQSWYSGSRINALALILLINKVIKSMVCCDVFGSGVIMNCLFSYNKGSAASIPDNSFPHIGCAPIA